MSASKTTTNYHLPVFEPTDVPAWLTDWNSAMGDIDTAIAGAKTAADTAQLTASGAANGVSTLNTTVGNLQTTVGNQGSTITSLGNSLNTVQSLIGNGTPTTTDQTIIGAINEINAAYKDAENIKFDNTGTGMSATNVQAAIVEAYGHGGGGGSTAAAVSYDNTDSGLTATNVQDAIDEVQNELKLDYSNSSLPATTTTNEFLQMMLDRFYPIAPPEPININTKPSTYFTTDHSAGGSATFNPIVLKATGSSAFSTAMVKTSAIDATNYSSLAYNTTVTGGTEANITIKKASDDSSLKVVDLMTSPTGTINLSDVNGEIVVNMYLGSGINTSGTVSYTQLLMS